MILSGMIAWPSIAMSHFMPQQITVESMFSNDINTAHTTRYECAGPAAVGLTMPPLSVKIDLFDDNFPGKGMIETCWR